MNVPRYWRQKQNNYNLTAVATADGHLSTQTERNIRTMEDVMTDDESPRDEIFEVSATVHSVTAAA